MWPTILILILCPNKYNCDGTYNFDGLLSCLDCSFGGFLRLIDSLHDITIHLGRFQGISRICFGFFKFPETNRVSFQLFYV